MNSEPIYAALFAKLQTLKTNSIVNTCSRRLLHWSNCPIDAQPAIYMAQGNQTPVWQDKNLPAKWDLEVKIYIYVHAPEDSTPATILNPILDEIRNILNPPFAGGLQTLGGLCDHVRIDGSIETYEGTLGEQEVAIIPIKILAR